MADINLKTETPDTSLPTTGFLFGADSQAAASPSVYTTQAVATTLLGSTTLSGATITADAPVLNLSQTWNNGAVTFTGLKFNVVSDTSATASLLMDLQVGSASQFSVSKTGATQYKASGSVQVYAQGRVGGAFTLYSSGGIGLLDVQLAGTCVRNVGTYSFGSSSDASAGGDTYLTRRAAANLRLGAADAAAPVAQTLSVQSVVTGTSNIAGANFTITGSQGTGTGAGGSIIFQVAPAGGSGAAQNALATALTIASTNAITVGANGTISFPTSATTSPSAAGIGNWVGTLGIFGTSGILTATVSGSNINMSSTVSLEWGNDTRLFRDAANTLALRNGANAQAFRVYNTFTDATTFERANIFWDSNVLKIGTEKGSVGGTARALEFQTNGTTRLTISATGPVTVNYVNGLVISDVGGNGFSTSNGGYIIFKSSGVLTLSDATDTNFNRLQFGGTTSSFPALKRSTTTLQAVLANDGGFTNIQGKLTTDTAYTATVIVPTGYLTLYDSTGTAYRVPCVV